MLEQLNQSFNATIKSISIATKDVVNEVTVKLEAKFTRDEAKLAFGDEAARIAFSDQYSEKMDDGEEVPQHTCNGGHAFLFDVGAHEVTIEDIDQKLKAIVSIGNAVAAKGERAVWFDFSFTFETLEANDEAVGALARKKGTQRRVTFKAIQTSLALSGNANDSSDEPEEDGGERANVDAPGKNKGRRVTMDASSQH